MNELLKSKRVWLSGLFNAGVVIPMINEAQAVKNQADGMFAGMPYGEYISYGVVAVYMIGMVWTKLHDDSKASTQQ